MIFFRSYLGQYARTVAALAGAAVLLYVVADFGDRFKHFVEHPAQAVAELYWNKALVALHQLSPAVLLLSAGVTATAVRKRGEWVALQALGRSRWALLGPILAFAAPLAAALVAFDDAVVTRAGERVDRMLVERFAVWGDFRFFYAPKQWFRVGSRIVHVRGASSPDGALTDVTVLTLDAHFGLAERLDAERLTPLGGDRWRAQGASVRTFGPQGTSTVARNDVLELTLPGSKASTFQVRVGRPELMPLAQLLDQRALRREVGLPVERFDYAVHNRLAYPFSGAGAAALAAILALRRARTGHLTAALVEGLAVSVLLFSLMLAGKALSVSGLVPPPLAAWTPVAVPPALAALAWWRDEA